MSDPPDPTLWPLVVYALAVLLVVAALMAASWLLGERHRATPADAPFESGIVGLGYGHFRVPVAFYLVAMFFVIFDVEAAFLFAWAVALREAGWPGFIEAIVFILVLLAALAYLWRIGALDWGPKRSDAVRTETRR